MHSLAPAAHVAAFTSFAKATSRAKKAALFLFSLAVLLVGGAAAVRGQSALDGFDPNANGQINVVVVQPDGKILLGGTFTTLAPNGGAPVTRNHIARLNPDGTLDTVFDPNASGDPLGDPRGYVLSIAIQADGKILAGGYFSSIGGQTRNRIARLDATTGMADSFDPNATGGFSGFGPFVNSIAVQADGKILAGGEFDTIGGQTRNRIARLDATTGLADSFNPNANFHVSSIVVQADGKVLVCGSFTSIGAQTRHRITRLDATTGLADSFNPNASDDVVALAVQADGKILAIGSFSSIGGQTRNYIARLDATTGLADSFDPNPNGGVSSIAVQADGKILAGGGFFVIGGQTRNHIARLDATTGLADSFDPNANSIVDAIAVQADGKVLAGGRFTTLAPNVIRNRIARLETDGRIDQTLNLNVSINGAFGPLGFDFFDILATAVQPDGKILIGGDFRTVLGVTRRNIARLNADGTLDTAFNPNPNATGSVSSIAVQADGKILVGGTFSSIGGQTRNRIARLDATSGLADSFDPNPNGGVSSIAVQADGKTLVGGGFGNIGGQSRNRIARLDPTTGLADSFDPNPNSFVSSIAVQADGKVLAAGAFTTIGGAMRNYIARLDGATGLADSFDPNANNQVYAIAVNADGKILAGGTFTNIGGQPRNRIARLDGATGLADSFDPNANNQVNAIAVNADGKILAGGAFTNIGGQPRNRIARLDGATGLADLFDPNANNSVLAITVQADGKVLAGGNFFGDNSIGGQPRFLFARLSNDTAALQNLGVTQTTITWTRGGSSPQFTRVTFEYSTDNVNYTPLGNGTADGSNWTLTGLSLPTGQNIYIRARGYYGCGARNGSESTTESVRNAVTGSLQLTAAVSRKTHGGAGTFDIPLPLSSPFGVECRSTGGAYTLVFATSNNLVSGNASVTTGTGTVSGSPSFAGNTMTVNVTGVTDVQMITVTLSGVTDSFAQVLPDTAVSMNMLVGDTTGNKTVNASDVAQTKGQSGAAATAANFRTDINVSGTVTASDIAQVKANAGHTVP